MGECFFWYQPTRVVPDQRPLNGCVYVCVYIPGGPKKRLELSHGVMQQSRLSESAEKHVCNERTSSNMSMNFHLKRFSISRDTREIVLHVIKQCLQAFCQHRNWFSKLMVSAGVSWNGKNNFFIDPQKTKVDQKIYVDFLKTSLMPECRRLYPDNDYVFLQDSAPPHRAKATQNFLRDNTPDFINSQEWTPHARFESARVLSLGYLARTCRRRNA